MRICEQCCALTIRQDYRLAIVCRKEREHPFSRFAAAVRNTALAMAVAQVKISSSKQTKASRIPLSWLGVGKSIVPRSRSMRSPRMDLVHFRRLHSLVGGVLLVALLPNYDWRASRPIHFRISWRRRHVARLPRLSAVEVLRSMRHR